MLPCAQVSGRPQRLGEPTSLFELLILSLCQQRLSFLAFQPTLMRHTFTGRKKKVTIFDMARPRVLADISGRGTRTPRPPVLGFPGSSGLAWGARGAPGPGGLPAPPTGVSGKHRRWRPHSPAPPPPGVGVAAGHKAPLEGPAAQGPSRPAPAGRQRPVSAERGPRVCTPRPSALLLRETPPPQQRELQAGRPAP